jgi:hypothetical protein
MCGRLADEERGGRNDYDEAVLMCHELVALSFIPH